MPGPSKRQREAAEAWESLFRAQVAVMRRLQVDPIFKRLSIREYDLLFNISKCNTGWVRLSELADHALITQPSISRMVDRLERAGLLQRKTVAEDRRGVLVGLTSAGRKLQREIGMEHVREIDALIGPVLTSNELAALKTLSDKLRVAVEQQQPQVRSTAARDARR